MTTRHVEPAHGLGRLMLKKHQKGECGWGCPYCKQGDAKGVATPLATWVPRPGPAIDAGNAKSTQKELYEAIQRERAYQLAKYPSENDRPRTTSGYMIVAEQELGEAWLAFCREANGDEEARRELLQVVAVGVAWCESRGTSWEDMDLELLYTDAYAFPVWLRMMKAQFFAAGLYMLEDPRDSVAQEVAFDKIIAMGMRCLMLHGVAERPIIEFYEDAKAVSEGAEPRGFFKAPFDLEALAKAVKASGRFIPIEQDEISRWGDFRDAYGVACSIQEGWLGTGDKARVVWLGVEREGIREQGMHLTQDMAAALLPLLHRFVQTGRLPEPLEETDDARE